jgi:hypothetical protein
MSRRVGWSLLFAVCVLYAGFAVWLAAAEALSLAGLAGAAKARAVPVAFVVHATTGAVCLVAGAVQFNRRIRQRYRRVHGTVGRVYVWSAWASSATALVSAALFDVPAAARVVFAVAAVTWFVATSVARARILARRVADHREWMLRSFSLALFFVVFEFWVSALEATPLDHEIAYPLGVLMAWLGNTAAAEIWIRRTRSTQQRPSAPSVLADPDRQPATVVLERLQEPPSALADMELHNHR